MFARDKAAHNNVRGTNEGAKEMIGEPRNEADNKPIHPCGAGFQRFERFVFLLAIVVVLLDIFIWRP